MKAQVSVTTKGLKPLVAKLHTIEELKTLRPLLEDASKIAVTTARQNAPHFTGALVGGFVSDIEPFSARVHTISGKYPIVMEGGRKPLAAGGKMPPTQPLVRWAEAHGINNVFMLARAIQKRGIKGRFFRRKARSAVRKEMPRLLDRMAHDIEKIWGHPVSEAD